MRGDLAARFIGLSGWRLALGVLAAALAATFTPLLVFILFWLVTEAAESRLNAAALSDALRSLAVPLVVLPYVLLLTLIGGLPLHLLLVVRGWERGRGHLLAGALGGGALLGSVELAAAGRIGFLLPLGVLAGLAAALAFRGVWRPLPPAEMRQSG
ncbi:hypothetical protein [Falsiroseomonas sp.]|uniref:hypothetical protein n=1 Tax=Falsiroseomonas sp. TaxID=2870721 RepID=UPI003F6E99E9